MLHNIRLWCLVLLLLVSVKMAAQEAARDTSVRFFGLPLVFYSQDTGWGFGAGGVFTFRGNPLRSSVTFSLAYTQRKQWLVWFPYSWFSRGGQWRAYGEVGWYSYLYQYFGIGNSYPNSFIETYTARYPRLRLTVAKNVNTKQLLGLRLNLDDYRIVDNTPGGEIDSEQIPGAKGGLSSGLGAVWLYDSRDQQFYPHKGWFSEVSLLGEDKITGSAFQYLRFSVDAAHYQPLGPKCVLATNAVVQLTGGNPPFFQLASLGGSRRLRGYPDFKYRDRHMMLLQTEFRFPMFWRFKGVLFAATGTVFGTPGEKLNWRPNAGAGLRIEFDRKQQQHIRIDYGLGRYSNNSGFYLTFGEAF